MGLAKANVIIFLQGRHLMREKIYNWLGILPAVIVAALVFTALSGYVSPELSGNTSDSTDKLTSEIIENIDNTDSKLINTKSDSNNVNKYKDGTYEGVGNGFGGQIKVQVKISGGKITDIIILSHSDGDAFINSASQLLSDIILKQTTNVDTVSGATFSSNGLIEAVRNALAKASVAPIKNNSQSTKSTTLAPKAAKTPKKKTVKKQVDVITGLYNDGVYTGTGEGYRGDISISVTIKNGKIKSMKVLKTSDDNTFFSRASSLLNVVLKKQSTDVDAVSGATYSSEGILEAINDALSKAVKKAATDKKDNSSVADTNESSTANTENDIDSSESKNVYLDGTYIATAICSPDEYYDFEPYSVSVTISIKDNRITEIKNIYGHGDEYEDDNDWYLERAANGTSKRKGVANQFLDDQNADIDAVSGATCSSKALINAINEALKQAKSQ